MRYAVLLSVSLMACAAPIEREKPREEVTKVEALPRYPDAPYGLQPGDIFPPVRLAGYRDGSAPWTTIDVSSYYDPNGTRGIRAIVIDVEAAWCSSSKSFAAELPGRYADVAGRGARFLSVLIQNGAREPASVATADEWLARFRLPFDLAIDTERLTLPTTGGTVGLPYGYVIDPRTMRIVRVFSALSPGAPIPGLENLLSAD